MAVVAAQRLDEAIVSERQFQFAQKQLSKSKEDVLVQLSKFSRGGSVAEDVLEVSDLVDDLIHQLGSDEGLDQQVAALKLFDKKASPLVYGIEKVSSTFSKLNFVSLDIFRSFILASEAFANAEEDFNGKLAVLRNSAHLLQPRNEAQRAFVREHLQPRHQLMVVDVNAYM